MDRLFSSQALQELLCWQDPVHTGVVFSIVNLVFFLLTVGDYTVITLGCYLLCFFLLVNAGFKGAKLALNSKKDPFGTLQHNDFLLSEEQLRRASGILHQVIDGVVLGAIRSLFSLNTFNLVPVIKLYFALYFTALFGKLVSGIGILYLAAFTIPYCRKERKADFVALMMRFEEKLPRVYRAFMAAWLRISQALSDDSATVPNDS